MAASTSIGYTYVEVELHSSYGGDFTFDIHGKEQILDSLQRDIAAIYPSHSTQKRGSSKFWLQINANSYDMRETISRIEIFQILDKYGFELRCSASRSHVGGPDHGVVDRWTFVSTNPSLVDS